MRAATSGVSPSPHIAAVMRGTCYCAHAGYRLVLNLLPSQCPKKAEQRLLLLLGLDVIEDRIGSVGILGAAGTADQVLQKHLDPQGIQFGPAIVCDDDAVWRHIEFHLEIRHEITGFAERRPTCLSNVCLPRSSSSSRSTGRPSPATCTPSHPARPA